MHVILSINCPFCLTTALWDHVAADLAHHGEQLLLSCPPKVLRAITWGRAVESISSIHLQDSFTFGPFIFLLSVTHKPGNFI